VPAAARTTLDLARGSTAEAQTRLALQWRERRRGDHVTRALDVAIAAGALVVLGPVLLVVAAAIRLTSGPPVLYRGLRIGRGGQPFQMVKFRTLDVGCEQRFGRLYGADLTERTRGETTPIGRALRATHVDELPQLWNVLRGDMSMVGPRPLRPLFLEQVCEAHPVYWQRLVVRPGMTGFAQLRKPRETTWEEKLSHDLEYVADRSVRLYLLVVATTAWRILSRSLTGRPGAVPRGS
jgi:lipopolysaccharide/colanic/teichoic acid biosynthesis glycosyltransferase